MKWKVMPIIMIVLMLLSSTRAYATWSIVAVDPVTGEVGSAGASYTPAVWVIVGLAPGHGVMVAQAETNEAARVQGVKMLMEGVAPQAIIDEITSEDFDPRAAYQQYGIVSLDGEKAAYTGNACTEWAVHRTDENVTVQGNILADKEEVDKVMEAFQKAKDQGLPLKECLLKALEAGASAGGDARAGDAKAMTAYLVVSKPSDEPNTASFGIIIPPQKKGINPVETLRTRYELLKGQDHLVKFPKMNMVWLIFVGIPVMVGLLISVPLLICRSTVSRKYLLRNAVITTFAPVVNYGILLMIARMMHWIIPFYGMYSWMVPVAIAIISLIFHSSIQLVKYMLCRRYRSGNKLNN
ncbi:MAG: hypothetical protein K0S47_4242 [Herbinix sp.]|nr:hypothetical protein [Herbinix sp.]